MDQVTIRLREDSWKSVDRVWLDSNLQESVYIDNEHWKNLTIELSMLDCIWKLREVIMVTKELTHFEKSFTENSRDFI